MEGYKTLSERYNLADVRIHFVRTDPNIYNVVNRLVTGRSTVLTIPQFDERDVVIDEFKVTSGSNSDDLLFLPPYDPIVVRHNGSVLAILNREGMGIRSEAPGTFVLDEFGKIAKDPEYYFEKIGEKFGACMICGKKLTSESSLGKSMGPVCYGRVSAAAETSKAYQVEDVVSELEQGAESYEALQGSIKSAAGLYTEEQTGLYAFNRTMKSYRHAGLYIDPTGKLSFARSDSPVAVYLDPSPDPAAKGYIKVISPVIPSQYDKMLTAISNLDSVSYDEAGPVVVLNAATRANKRTTIVGASPIPPLPHGLDERGAPPLKSSARDADKASSTPPLVKHEIDDKTGNYLVYGFPRSLYSSLAAISGAKYNAGIKRFVIPHTQLEALQQIVSLA